MFRGVWCIFSAGPKRKHLDTVRIILMPYSFGQFCKALVILTASALTASCSPIYSIGVPGALTQPMSVDCILNAAQTTEGVQHVLTHQDEPRKGGELIQVVDNFIDPPTAYLVTTIDQVAKVEQRPLKDGRSASVGRQDVESRRPRTQLKWISIYVRLASHIAEACKALCGQCRADLCSRFRGVPEAWANPRSK
jgi:hypothetical protein